MLVKILGIFDILGAILLFALSFGINLPKGILIFFIVVLFLKGLFILTGSIASVFDIIAGAVILFSLYYDLHRLLFFFPALLLLQKGFFSLTA